MVRISIEEINEAKKILNRINNYSIEDIIFTENGKDIEINKENYEQFKFSGLNNVDFIWHDLYKLKNIKFASMEEVNNYFKLNFKK